MSQNPESARLQEAGTLETIRTRTTVRHRQEALEKVGALPERAAVGNGSRGLQPGWQCLGLLHS